jgi:hypothetical protein
MSSRSERYLAKAEECQQYADAADTSGIKRLYGGLASQWRQLAEEADWTDQIGSRPLLEKIRYARTLRQIDKAEGVIREFGAVLKGEPLLTPKEHRQLNEKEPQTISCPSRKSYPPIAMVQSAQDWCGDECSRSLDGSS